MFRLDARAVGWLAGHIAYDRVDVHTRDGVMCASGERSIIHAQVAFPPSDSPPFVLTKADAIEAGARGHLSEDDTVDVRSNAVLIGGVKFPNSGYPPGPMWAPFQRPSACHTSFDPLMLGHVVDSVNAWREEIGQRVPVVLSQCSAGLTIKCGALSVWLASRE